VVADSDHQAAARLVVSAADSAMYRLTSASSAAGIRALPDDPVDQGAGPGGTVVADYAEHGTHPDPRRERGPTW
jgi:hypothetical protein